MNKADVLTALEQGLKVWIPPIELDLPEPYQTLRSKLDKWYWKAIEDATGNLQILEYHQSGKILQHPSVDKLMLPGWAIYPY